MTAMCNNSIIGSESCLKHLFVCLYNFYAYVQLNEKNRTSAQNVVILTTIRYCRTTNTLIITTGERDSLLPCILEFCFIFNYYVKAGSFQNVNKNEQVLTAYLLR